MCSDKNINMGLVGSCEGRVTTGATETVSVSIRLYFSCAAGLSDGDARDAAIVTLDLRRSSESFRG